MEGNAQPAGVKPARALRWNVKEVYLGLLCPYCGSGTRIIDSALVYKQDDGWLMACTEYPDCKSFVRCHTRSMRPLGGLADDATRRARGEAHAAFDRRWRRKGRGLRRGARLKAYAWLAEKLGIKPELCHIGYFDAEMCGRVVEACKMKEEGS